MGLVAVILAILVRRIAAIAIGSAVRPAIIGSPAISIAVGAAIIGRGAIGVAVGAVIGRRAAIPVGAVAVGIAAIAIAAIAGAVPAGARAVAGAAVARGVAARLADLVAQALSALLQVVTLARGEAVRSILALQVDEAAQLRAKLGSILAGHLAARGGGVDLGGESLDVDAGAGIGIVAAVILRSGRRGGCDGGKGGQGEGDSGHGGAPTRQ